MTLHLARASALENAGICLHPLYGFAYLPGTGLKGMAHTFATEVWLPSQPHSEDAWKQICRVFGWGPSPWLHKLANRLEVTIPKGSRAGEVVFHDGWPTEWPRLEMDIVNSHHSEYYQAHESDNEHPPGDWENPVPVYFLRIAAGTRFQFAVGKRHEEVSDEHVDLARTWLLGALCHLGAGAKTNAGYGSFRFESQCEPAEPVVQHVKTTWQQAQESKQRAEFTCTLELVTPAFLAGASRQDAVDCNLRPATLRGLLRWWWRTMHAGYVDVATLRRMEAAIWGDTKQGGTVRIEVVNKTGVAPERYVKSSKVRFASHQKVSDYGIADADPNKTAQGLWYLSFGMDDAGKQRFYVDPGAAWDLQLTARPASERLSAELVIDQALAALWLLVHFGGVGSRSRKGFGSLSATKLNTWNIDRCLDSAGKYRRAFMLPTGTREQVTVSSALGQRLGPVEVAVSWPDVWQVLDQVGFAYQAFAKEYSHHLEKKTLGLPRRIKPPPRGQFSPHDPMKTLLAEARREENVRHASPVHVHLAKTDDGFIVRVIAFPLACLPDEGNSRLLLGKFLDHMEADLQRRAKLPPPAKSIAASGQRHGGRSTQGRPGAGDGERASSSRGDTVASVTKTPPPQTALAGNRPHGTPVTVKIVAARPKGGFDVQEAGKPQGTLTLGQPPSPPPEVGNEVTAYVHNDDPKRPQYRWDRPQPKTKKPPGGKRRHP
jgi:CRISPR-associated protein Cmr6